MGKLMMKVESFEPLPDEVYKQVKYEVVMKDNALTEDELDEVLERICKIGRFNSTFIRDVVIDVCGGIDEIEKFDAYILGRLVGYLRAIFLMHEINGNAIEKPKVEIYNLIMYGVGDDFGHY